ncbi:MAG: hypothetical protein A3F68_00250 [Acidobacteria bacterium RIFCSPLOWO2_12_FULL_54_10]|nr:MAG: hypothetical protein A3F68_00250 [Acidobacteria bacterium RIFCSPLOWO2_12_FULL_54_10]
MASGTRRATQVCQITGTLADSQPPIWPRTQVQSDITLAELHRIVQVVMGWTDMHLHQFIIGNTYCGVPDEEEIGLRKTKDERDYEPGSVVLFGAMVQRMAALTIRAG